MSSIYKETAKANIAGKELSVGAYWEKGWNHEKPAYRIDGYPATKQDVIDLLVESGLESIANKELSKLLKQAIKLR